jgi:protein phosphatase 1 regulatory subunit 37
MVWFQRIDLRDNSLKVAGLMALALALKVNTSVTQLDLDDVPKKKMVNFSLSHFRTWS